MKDFLVTLRRNFVSPIVIAILLLGTALLLLGETRDAFFISSVIIVNTLLAIVQEMRARLALKKLELMSAPHARRLTQDGTYEEILYDQLRQGDVIKVQPGDEVPADGDVRESVGLEVDESMLTGESASVEKPVGSTVYAASAVVAGNAVVRVDAVGAALVEHGIAVASINYRLAPESTYPAQNNDVACAIKAIAERADEFGLDPSRMGLFGDSAGGLLAATYTLHQPADVPRIKGVGIFYGTTDLPMQLHRFPHKRSNAATYLGAPSTRRAQDASPLYQPIPPGTPPFSSSTATKTPLSATNRQPNSTNDYTPKTRKLPSPSSTAPATTSTSTAPQPQNKSGTSSSPSTRTSSRTST